MGKMVWPETEALPPFNDLYKDDPSKQGFSISMGHHSYLSSWKTDDTIIQLALTGNNFEIMLFVQYESIFFQEIMKKSSEEEDLDKF